MKQENKMQSAFYTEIVCTNIAMNPMILFNRLLIIRILELIIRFGNGTDK